MDALYEIFRKRSKAAIDSNGTVRWSVNLMNHSASIGGDNKRNNKVEAVCQRANQTNHVREVTDYNKRNSSIASAEYAHVIFEDQVRLGDTSKVINQKNDENTHSTDFIQLPNSCLLLQDENLSLKDQVTVLQNLLSDKEAAYSTSLLELERMKSEFQLYLEARDVEHQKKYSQLERVFAKAIANHHVTEERLRRDCDQARQREMQLAEEQAALKGFYEGQLEELKIRQQEEMRASEMLRQELDDARAATRVPTEDADGTERYRRRAQDALKQVRIHGSNVASSASVFLLVTLPLLVDGGAGPPAGELRHSV